MKNKTLRIFLIVLITFFVGFFAGTLKINLDWHNYKPILNVSGKEPPAGVINVDFNPFWTVWQSLQANYYDKSKLDQQKMLNGAISGMVNALGDPFTMYLPPTQNTDFKSGLAGQFSGIGAELGTKDTQIIVIAPLAGSPAEKAGIKAGDAILKVDGEATINWTLSSAVDKIRGPKGATITLSILHKDSGAPVDIKIVSDT